MQILYQLDMTEPAEDGAIDFERVDAAVTAYWASFEPVTDEERNFAERIARGVAAEIDAIDSAITAVSHNWRLARMDRVDRNLLRLAAFEILRCPDIPRVASINEAVEIAKRYSGKESAAFINGVLDKLAEGEDE